MFTKIINWFKKKKKDREIVGKIIPFNKVFKSLPDGRLELIPKCIKLENNYFGTETGKLVLSKGNILGNIKWHDHIGKKLVGNITKDYIEIIGFKK